MQPVIKAMRKPSLPSLCPVTLSMISLQIQTLPNETATRAIPISPAHKICGRNFPETLQSHAIPSLTCMNIKG